MKRVFLAIAGTVSGLVLLLGFKTHPAGTGDQGDTGTAAPVPPPAANGGTAKTPATRTVTGDTIDTRWGPVQVEVTLRGGTITRVRAIRLPSENRRDLEINDFAVPRLDREALAAQSARIDAVSGATYTSDGYTRSLQSALDKAGR